MLNDLRYALRTLNGNRLFAAMALLSLALGIGANTVIYSFMDAILVRTLPIHDPKSLVVIQWHAKERPPIAQNISGSMWNDDKLGRVSPNLPWRTFEILNKDNAVLSHVVSYRDTSRITAIIGGEGTTLDGLLVTGGFFGALGTPPAVGRLIGFDDDREGTAPVAMVSHGFAQRRFGSPQQALGQTAIINDNQFTIVGVTPAGFYGIRPGQAHDLYLPMKTSLLIDRIYGRDPRLRYTDERFYWAEVLGRLKPGVTLAEAQAALGPLFHNYVSDLANTDEEREMLPTLVVRDASRGLDQLRRQYSKPLFFLMTLVGLILAIACANLANLLLARAAGRRREIAVRLSLGAGRGRIVRQLLTESVLLSVLGGLLGLLFAHWGARGLMLLMANGRDTFALNVDLNWRVLAVTMGLTLLTGVLFGLAPALQSTRVDITTALKQTRAGEAKRQLGSWIKVSLSRALVVTQIAVSLLLLVAAGLFARTLIKLNSVELGFNKENLLLFNVNARQAGYKPEEMPRFFENLHQRFASIPGVRHATATNYAIVSGSMNSTRLTVPGYTGNDSSCAMLEIASNFFETMQIPIQLGRPIEMRDIAGAARVAVVNEVFAKRFFPEQNPVGRRFIQGRAPNTREYEIIGVARNTRYNSLKGEIPAVAYLPYTHDPQSIGSLTFELRAAGDPKALIAAAREIVQQADSRIPLTNIKTQEEIIDQTIGQERTFAMLCTAFALLAVAIACVGLYGTMAYSVARRTNEIGIRMALGAERKRMIWMVLREVFVMSAVGLAIGLPIALATSKFVKSFLFEMQPNDPWAISGAAVVLVLAALAAGYGPAWRASRIDPWNALRHE
jgi:predicted permease